MKIVRFLALQLLAVVLCYGAPAEDEITDLPGLTPPPAFKQYSGYLDATDGRHLHYWLVEAQQVDAATAPVIFWFNGGPGCSSLDGFLTENGPFHTNDDGETLYYNEYAWNQLANYVYLESPAGVGFSYKDDGSYITDDDQTAIDNYAALQSFFVKFPEYLPNPLFITGESYAGIYIPTLSYLIANGTAGFNFQGFAIGNGLHDSAFNYNSEILFNGYHGVFDQDILNTAISNCCPESNPLSCQFYSSLDPACINAVLEADAAKGLSGLNEYGIYGTCEHSDELMKQSAGRYRLYPQGYSEEQKKMLANLKLDPPCTDSKPERTYLNSAAVRAALHIPDTVQDWDLCSDRVSVAYISNYFSMTSQYTYLLDHVRAMLYHGDTDTMCNYIGGSWFADSLGREVLQDYRPWFYDNQTAGFSKTYSSLTFVTVLGAGHMVPTDRAPQALKMINNFILNEPFI